MAEFYRETQIKSTRNQHRCMGCLEFIPAGSEARYISGKYSYEFYAGHLCKVCTDYMDKYDDYKDPWDGSWFEGSIGEARREREREAASCE